IIARIDRGRVQLITRNGKDWTERYPPVAEELRDWPVTTALIDGEVVILLPDGRTSFQALQNWELERLSGTLVYFVFDLLHVDGRDLLDVPLLERKALLESLVAEAKGGAGARVRFSDHVRVRGAAFLEQACRHGLEGIISKRADSRYVPGRRSPDWVKVKCVKRQEFVIIGYTEPSGSRSGF